MCFQRVVEPVIDPCQNPIGRLVLDRQGGCSVSSASQQRSCDALERRGPGGERAAAREATLAPPGHPVACGDLPKIFFSFFRGE
jgi:hypothetical protein